MNASVIDARRYRVLIACPGRRDRLWSRIGDRAKAEATVRALRLHGLDGRVVETPNELPLDDGGAPCT